MFKWQKKSPQLPWPCFRCRNSRWPIWSNAEILLYFNLCIERAQLAFQIWSWWNFEKVGILQRAFKYPNQKEFSTWLNLCTLINLITALPSNLWFSVNGNFHFDLLSVKIRIHSLIYRSSLTTPASCLLAEGWKMIEVRAKKWQNDCFTYKTC